MFRTVPLSIIRSFSLYTQQWYVSYRFVDSLRAGSGRNSFMIKLYMFRTFSLSIIRSFSLYTQQWCMSYRLADSLRAGSGRNSFMIKLYMFRTVPLSIIRCFFTAHTAMLYGIQVRWQLASRIRMELSPDKTLHVSDSSSVHHQVFFHYTHSNGVCHTGLLCLEWKTRDDGQRNCPKHVEFYSKNKSEKLVHLVSFIIIKIWEISRPFRLQHYF